MRCQVRVFNEREGVTIILLREVGDVPRDCDV